MSQIEQLLRETIGLDAASVGSTLIERAARLRMKQLGVKHADDYFALLKKFPSELNELIEAVVVTETWFFRDDEPFKIFARLVLEEWPLKHIGTQLRILSVPCSTGEEPYSIAMTLLDAGLPPQGFLLDAMDVSERALERARLAVYGKNSFRGKALEFRARHFTQTGHGAVLDVKVRDCVRFHRGNLLGEDFPKTDGAYHFIFCRNLFIYLDPSAQQKVFARLKQLLAPDGVLFLGPAELPIAVMHGFVSTNIPMAFACRKVSPVSAARAQPDVRSQKTEDSPPPAVLWPPTSAPEPPSLDKARRLADAGRLQEAADICQGLLHTHGASATAFYLLGLARDASGNTLEAESCFRKALYLEPNHHEALQQMVSLSQKKGDDAQARVFQRRARRVLSKRVGET